MYTYLVSVYVHSAICEMLFEVMVFHTSIFNWSGGYMYPQYMCILLYVKLIWCNGILWIHCSLECGGNVSSVYVHSPTCESYVHSVLFYHVILL